MYSEQLRGFEYTEGKLPKIINGSKERELEKEES
jgi:hypothetical protein